MQIISGSGLRMGSFRLRNGRLLIVRQIVNVGLLGRFFIATYRNLGHGRSVHDGCRRCLNVRIDATHFVRYFSVRQLDFGSFGLTDATVQRVGRLVTSFSIAPRTFRCGLARLSGFNVGDLLSRKAIRRRQMSLNTLNKEPRLKGQTYLDFTQTCDHKSFGRLENGRQQILRYSYLASIHEFDDQLEILKRHVFQNDDRILMRIDECREQVGEVGRTSGQH
jgi:hypothetical protein